MKTGLSLHQQEAFRDGHAYRIESAWDNFLKISANIWIFSFFVVLAPGAGLLILEPVAAVVFLERRLHGIELLCSENAPFDKIVADAGLKTLLTSHEDEKLIKTQQTRPQGILAEKFPPLAMAQDVLDIEVIQPAELTGDVSQARSLDFLPDYGVPHLSHGDNP